MDDLMIGDVIYYLFNNTSLQKVKVFMIGKYEWIHEEAFDDRFSEEYRAPISLFEEGKTWFRSLDEANNYIKLNGWKLEQLESDYWEVVKEVVK